MISLKEYQDALKVVEEYRKQQYKLNYGIKINPLEYAEYLLSDTYMPANTKFHLEQFAKYEIPDIKWYDLKLKHFNGISKNLLLQYRSFGKRKLEILEHHLSLAGLHLEP